MYSDTHSLLQQKSLVGLFGRQKENIIRKCCYYNRRLGGTEMLIFMDSEDTVVE
jgi:hypothetical protein